MLETAVLACLDPNIPYAHAYIMYMQLYMYMYVCTASDVCMYMYNVHVPLHVFGRLFTPAFSFMLSLLMYLYIVQMYV